MSPLHRSQGNTHYYYLVRRRQPSTGMKGRRGSRWQGIPPVPVVYESGFAQFNLPISQKTTALGLHNLNFSQNLLSIFVTSSQDATFFSLFQDSFHTHKADFSRAGEIGNRRGPMADPGQDTPWILWMATLSPWICPKEKRKPLMIHKID